MAVLFSLSHPPYSYFCFLRSPPNNLAISTLFLQTFFFRHRFIHVRIIYLFNFSKWYKRFKALLNIRYIVIFISRLPGSQISKIRAHYLLPFDRDEKFFRSFKNFILQFHCTLIYFPRPSYLWGKLCLHTWCFWNVVLEKTLKSPLDTKETNLSILKEISPEYSLEGLMLKLKPQ